MEVAALTPLPVGLLAWSSPEPTHTVIVKATYAIGGGGLVGPSPTQLPLSLDVASRHGGDAVDYASDFAPRKRGVDVLVVGHACAAAPSRVIPLTVAVGSFTLQLCAVAGHPSDRIPLDLAHVRRVPQDPSSAVRLGPTTAAVRGWANRTVAADFDFAAFNAAPHGHRLEGLRLPFVVTLEGLTGRGERLTAQVSDLEPRIFLVNARQLEGRPIPLECDTVWIDTDQQQIALSWRGSFPRVNDAGLSYLAVAMQRSSLPLEWRELVPQLPGARWRPAVQPGDLQTDHRLARATPPPQGVLVQSQHDIPLDPNDLDPPTLAAFRLPPPTKRRDEETTGFYVNLPPAGDSLPFKAPAAPPAEGKPGKVLDDRSLPDQDRPPPVPSSPGPVDPEDATRAFVVPADDEWDDVVQTEVGFPAFVEDEPTPQDEEEAPVTPRAGMMLGGGMGFALGGATLAGPQREEPLPFGAAPPSEAAPRPAPDLRAGLPFERPSPPSTAPPPPPARSVGRETLVDDVEAGRASHPATPFQPASNAAPASRSERTTAFPPAPPSAATPWSGDRVGGETLNADQARAALEGVLPFVRPGAPQPAPVPPPAPAQPPRAPLIAPRPPQPLSQPLAASAPRHASAEREPEAPIAAQRSISLETYADVKAALWDGDRSLAEVLDGAGIDEADWNAHERRQAVALAKDASTGKGELARKVRAAILEARRRRGGGEEQEIAIDDYAALKVAVEEADEPGSVLRARGLNAEAWEQLQRRWAHRAKSDAAIARALRAKLAAARRAAAERG